MPKKNSNLLQASKFSVIGIINTLIDFTILNIFSSIVGWPRIPSNVVSTTFAMVFSFAANRQLVFKPSSKNYAKQALLFLLVTAFGLYVLQNSVIYLLTEVWTAPLDLGYEIVGIFGLGNIFSQEFAYTNGSKAAATVVSLVWNFFLYKKLVFADESKAKK